MFWAAAANVAGFRKASNDGIRGKTRSRGEDKNLLNDLQGVVGELVALSRLEGLGFSCTHDLLDVSGPVDDVDIRASIDGVELAIEAKCLLMAPNKHLFLVNEIAHERSVARCADIYTPVLTVVGADHAYVGSLSTWKMWAGGNCTRSGTVSSGPWRDTLTILPPLLGPVGG